MMIDLLMAAALAAGQPSPATAMDRAAPLIRVADGEALQAQKLAASTAILWFMGLQCELDPPQNLKLAGSTMVLGAFENGTEMLTILRDSTAAKFAKLKRSERSAVCAGAEFHIETFRGFNP